MFVIQRPHDPNCPKCRGTGRTFLSEPLETTHPFYGKCSSAMMSVCDCDQTYKPPTTIECPTCHGAGRVTP